MEIAADWMACWMDPARLVNGSISPFHQWCPSISGFFAINGILMARKSIPQVLYHTVFVPMARALSLLCEVGRMFWRCRGTLHHTGRGWPAQLTVRRNTNCFYLKMNRPVPQQHCNSVPLQQEWKNTTDSETWVSCANLNCTEIRVLKRVGKWVAVDFKLHLVAEAVSANPGNEFSSVLSVSFPRGPAKLCPQAWSVAGSKCNGPFPNNPRDGRSKADSLLPRLCKQI